MATPSTCEACGWISAVGAMVAFGSFGVPIKSKVTQSLNIDPLVMQSYKTSMCFLTCWLVMLNGEPIHFTPWGIVSGLFWVPGGIATICAIKYAGLAIGVGVTCSCIVLVSFTWGIFIFHEPVHSQLGACLAIICLMMGLVGMAYYSAPSTMLAEQGALLGGSVSGGDSESSESEYQQQQQQIERAPLTEDEVEEQQPEEVTCAGQQNLSRSASDDGLASITTDLSSPDSNVYCLGTKWSRRTLGILSGCFSGFYGGSIMVPMKWAPHDAKGLPYVVSFSVGASIVNLSFWILRFLYSSHVHGSFYVGYKALPSFHFRKMWKYGFACGTLWAIGNLFSILAVEFLGEGVGYSVTQTSMLVGGLWGIFYFHEVQGAAIITKWLVSAIVAVSGILLLSYEHHAA